MLVCRNTFYNFCIAIIVILRNFRVLPRAPCQYVLVTKKTFVYDNKILIQFVWFLKALTSSTLQLFRSNWKPGAILCGNYHVIGDNNVRKRRRDEVDDIDNLKTRFILFHFIYSKLNGMSMGESLNKKSKRLSQNLTNFCFNIEKEVDGWLRHN